VSCKPIIKLEAAVQTIAGSGREIIKMFQIANWRPWRVAWNYWWKESTFVSKSAELSWDKSATVSLVKAATM